MFGTTNSSSSQSVSVVDKFGNELFRGENATNPIISSDGNWVLYSEWGYNQDQPKLVNLNDVSQIIDLPNPNDNDFFTYSRKHKGFTEDGQYIIAVGRYDDSTTPEFLLVETTLYYWDLQTQTFESNLPLALDGTKITFTDTLDIINSNFYLNIDNTSLSADGRFSLKLLQTLEI